VRLLLLAVAVSLAATATARADEDDDEDGELVAFPKRSIGLSGVGHGSYIGAISESGFGVGLELALGRGRWQYFGESTLASTGYSSWTTGIDEMVVTGKMLHGGAGVRWLARQFRPDSGGGFELFLVSALGMQRFYFNDGGRLTRPELALGTGFQVRLYKRPRLAIRVDIRVVFTPGDREGTLVACRGRCDMDAGASTGFTTSFGVAW
jgi:hypothetical protein